MTRRARVAGVLVAFLYASMAAPSLAQVEAQRWTLGVSLHQSVADNLFLIGPDGPGDVITGATTSLSWARLNQSSSFSAMGWLSGQRFNRFNLFNGLQFGLNTSTQIGLSRRARLRLAGGYANGLNPGALYANIRLPQFDVKSGSATAGLTYAFAPDTSANAFVDAMKIRYRADRLADSSQLPGNAFVPTDVLAAVRPPSQNANLPSGLDETLQVLGLLQAEGLQALRLDFETWRVGASLSHALTPRTRLTIGGSYRQTYEKPRFFSEAGDQLEAQAAVGQTLGPTANVSVSYGYQDNRFQFHLRTHTLLARADKDFGRRVKADVSLGASYLDSPGYVTGWEPVGGAGLSVRLRRTSITLHYDRTRYQGLIVGRNQITNLVSASFSHVLARRVSLSGYGYYHDAVDELDRGYSSATTVLGASVNVGIRRRTSAGLSYSFLRFRALGLPTANSSVVNLSLSYARTWK